LVRNNFVVADYGPGFIGWVGRMPDHLVCVAPPGYEDEPTVRSVMRELVAREGGNCELCRNCPIGHMKD
jgi:hypothetical protein